MSIELPLALKKGYILYKEIHMIIGKGIAGV